jgi:hypothetical protein
LKGMWEADSWTCLHISLFGHPLLWSLPAIHSILNYQPSEVLQEFIWPRNCMPLAVFEE